MRVQQLRQSHSRRHKLAALLALFIPGLALADEAENVLRQSPLLNAPIRNSSKEVRAVDHTDLVPLPNELADPMGNGLTPLATESMVVGDVNGWIPRAGKSRAVSPLVVDPIAKSREPLSPLLGQPVPGQKAQIGQFQVGPFLSGPFLSGPFWTWPSDQVPSYRLHIGDGVIHGDGVMKQVPITGTPITSMPSNSDADSSIKLGQSASSTLKIVPNVLAADPQTLELRPESPAKSPFQSPANALAAQPQHRIAMAENPKSDGVNNPEQNEPAGEMTPEEIAAAEAIPGDAIPAEVADGVMPEAVDGGLVLQGDGAPLEPLPTEELHADEIASEDVPESGAASAAASTAGPHSDAAANSSGDSATNPASMEVRKLKLRDDSADKALSESSAIASGDQSQGKASGGDPISLKPLDPSIARMRVGDVEPRSIDEYESPESGELVQPPAPSARPQTDNPIQGDTVTSHGELILATGRHASNIAVKPHTMRLKPMIERTLKYYWDHPEDAAERTHWGMMHSIMVFDRDTQIISRRQRFNAVAWMAGNNPCRNQTLFTIDQHGILPKTGVGLQGHQGQLLAIFGQINVPLNYPVYASKQKFSVSDILQREMRDCKVKTELTFTLISLAHYTDSDTTWVSGDGQDWSVERVIQEELAQPIVGAACGGTHRLMGYGHSLRRRHAEGKPIDGQFERADRYVKDFVKYTWSLQNRDGSMSTSWYEKPEDNGDMDRKIQTTGHMLEMLMTVTPDADLQSPEMLRTVNFMANTLYTERGHEWQIGPKGHALRALTLYYQRVFGGSTPWRPGSGSRTAGASNVRTVR